MVNLIWFADEKNVHHVSTNQYGGLKSRVSRARNSAISQLLCVGALSWSKLLSAAGVKLSPQMHENDCFGQFCGCNDKPTIICHQRTRWSSPSKQGSYSATDSTSWEEQACTHTHYDVSITSRLAKKYLIYNRILLKYFKLVFLQLQLAKTSFKLIIIWLNYEKKKKESLLWNTVYVRFSSR